MKFANLIASVDDGFTLTVVDVGAIGGLHERWRPFRPLVAGVLFDPREQAGSGRAVMRGRDIVFSAALGAARTSATLHVTRHGILSSLFRPDAALYSRFKHKAAQTEVRAEETIALQPLDDIAEEFAFAPDVLKADIQGGELDALKGAERSLARTLFVETEVSFFPRYEGQPLFRDIDAHLSARGFEFIDFYRLKRYRHLNRAGLDNLSLGRGHRPGRLALADALFLLREDAATTRLAALDQRAASHMALKAIVILLAYGKADIAARWFDLFGARLDERAKEAASAALREAGARRLTTGHLWHVAEYAARRL